MYVINWQFYCQAALTDITDILWNILMFFFAIWKSDSGV